MPQLRISSINIDGGTQPRVSLNESVVAEYAEAIRAGISLPPVDVYRDGSTYWLADGFHRFHAHRHADQEMIGCTVHVGTRRDAVLFSVGANANHGLRRSNDDKRQAVLTLLQDDEWGQWSDREVARRCSVSPDTVGRTRASLSESDSDSPKPRDPAQPRKYRDKHGNESVMKVGRIGDKQQGVIASPPAVEKPTATAADGATSGHVEPGETRSHEAASPTAESEAGDQSDLDEVLADLQAENRRLVEEIKAAEAIDQVAETLKWRRNYDGAKSEKEAAERRTREATKREKFSMDQLRRCGRAVGEEDPRRIAAKVEALVKAAKEAGAWTA